MILHVQDDRNGRRPCICLITPGHVSSTPRIVREAEALSGAGYEVHLVSSSHHAPSDSLDEAILRRATWASVRVSSLSGAGALFGKLWRKMGRVVRRRELLMPLASARWIHNPGIGRLVDAAVATGANFFHGHCVGGLAAAGEAGARTGRPFGFDAEDFHEAETELVESDPFEHGVITRIMGAYLPKAMLLTAASPLIAEAYAKRYGIAMSVLLNVFPLRDAPRETVAARSFSEERPARFYWFSQTIGPGRGLERVMDVMARLRTPAELHLRGFCPPENRSTLADAARRAGLKRPIRFLPPASPDDMVRLAAEADLGLSLEERKPLNRDLCLTNKVFAYLLAGIPQLMSMTAAQSALAPLLGGAAVLADMTRPEDVAGEVDALLMDSDRFAGACRDARDLARKRFCWEVEGARLVQSFEAVLP